MAYYNGDKKLANRLTGADELKGGTRIPAALNGVERGMSRKLKEELYS